MPLRNTVRENTIDGPRLGRRGAGVIHSNLFIGNGQRDLEDIGFLGAIGLEAELTPLDLEPGPEGRAERVARARRAEERAHGVEARVAAALGVSVDLDQRLERTIAGYRSRCEVALGPP